MDHDDEIDERTLPNGRVELVTTARSATGFPLVLRVDGPDRESAMAAMMKEVKRTERRRI